MRGYEISLHMNLDTLDGVFDILKGILSLFTHLTLNFPRSQCQLKAAVLTYKVSV